MLKALTQNWWSIALQGLLLVIFGVLAFVNPTLTATSLTIWFAILIMAGGLISIVAVIRSWKEHEDKWMLLVEGIVSFLLGLLLFVMPGVTLVIISFLIAFWFIFTGIFRISMAIQLRKEIEGEGWMIVGGVLAVLFGLLIFARPVFGFGSIMILIGICAVIAGIAFIVVGFKLRKFKGHVSEKIEDVRVKFDERTSERTS